MKLELENFQVYSGKHIFEFEPGITMIVGPSSSGKSSIIRALRGIILNYISSSKARKYITHFKEGLRVDLQLDGETKYSWLKDTKNTSYKVQDVETLEEEIFEKCGNDDLEGICNKIDKEFPFVIRDKKLLNTHTEKDGMPFPFDLSDIELFKVFEELYNVSSSSIIFKYMKSLETKTNSEVKIIKEKIEDDKIKIEKIIDLENEYELEKLEDLKLRAEKIQAGMIGIDEDIKTAYRNNKTSKLIKEFLENNSYKEGIELELDRALDIYKELKDITRDIKIVDSNNKIEQIEVYNKEIDTSIINEYSSLCSDYNKSKSLNKDLKSIQEEIDDLKRQEVEIQERLANVEICPLCHQEIKKGK